MDSMKNLEKALADIIDLYMKDMNMPGCAVGVVLDSKSVLVKGFGVESIETGKQVSANSMFHCASITKTLTATAIMQLYEKGLVDLDRPVVDYLPYFIIKGDSYRKMTVRHMMSHISGMPNVYDDEWSKAKYSEDALEQHVRNFAQYEALWEPGTKYSYSNLAYETLGDMTAKISGMSYEAYVRENILKCIDMNFSSLLITEVPRDRMTSPHIMDEEDGMKVKVNRYYPYNRIHGPSAALCSNVEELSKYAVVCLDKGIGEKPRLLKPESYDMMWKIHGDKGRNNESVALGWFIKPHKKETLVFHTGIDDGYASNLTLIPAQKAAVVLLSNCDYSNLPVLMDRILDLIL